MKTAELTGAHLDYWVARAEGVPAEQLSIRRVQRSTDMHCVRHWQPYRCAQTGVLNYSTNWAQGGPLIEKYTITPYPSPFGGWDGYNRLDMHMHESRSDTPLIAICRAVVRAKFGDEVEEVAVCE